MGIKRENFFDLSTKDRRSVVPIPETITRITGYPHKLIIFKIHASPYWWMRTYDRRHIKRSTKTTDKREAIAAAKEFYEKQILEKHHPSKGHNKTSSFNYCAEQVILDDRERARRGELSHTYATTQRGLIGNYITRYFKNMDVRQIDYRALDGFKNFLFAQNLSATTVKTHFIPVKKILDYAQKTNLIRSSPLFPKVKSTDNPRGYFTLREYKHLRRTARKLLGQINEIIQRQSVDGETRYKKLRNVIVTEELLSLIPFMVYTFVRPTDLKNMRHQHIQIRKNGSIEYLLLDLPTSKRHDELITSMPRAAIFYRRLLELRDREHGDGGHSLDDDYVFMPRHPNRTYAYRQLARQFEAILKTANLKTGNKNETRTLYSLRHTSLMYRSLYGGNIDAFKLARNARTSVEMLDRFYLSRMESPHFTEELHAKKAKDRNVRK